MKGCKHPIWKILSAAAALALTLPQIALGGFEVWPPYSEAFGPDGPPAGTPAFISEIDTRSGGTTDLPNRDLLEDRLDERYTASCAGDYRALYDMLFPPIREEMSFDDYLLDYGIKDEELSQPVCIYESVTITGWTCTPGENPAAGGAMLSCILDLEIQFRDTADTRAELQTARFREVWWQVADEWYYIFQGPPF